MGWVQDTQPNPTTHGLKEKFRIWLEPSHEAIGSAAQESKRRVKRLVTFISHDAPSVISLFLKTA